MRTAENADEQKRPSLAVVDIPKSPETPKKDPVKLESYRESLSKAITEAEGASEKAIALDIKNTKILSDEIFAIEDNGKRDKLVECLIEYRVAAASPDPKDINAGNVTRITQRIYASYKAYDALIRAQNKNALVFDRSFPEGLKKLKQQTGAAKSYGFDEKPIAEMVEEFNAEPVKRLEALMKSLGRFDVFIKQHKASGRDSNKGMKYKKDYTKTGIDNERDLWIALLKYYKPELSDDGIEQFLKPIRHLYHYANNGDGDFSQMILAYYFYVRELGARMNVEGFDEDQRLKVNFDRTCMTLNYHLKESLPSTPNFKKLIEFIRKNPQLVKEIPDQLFDVDGINVTAELPSAVDFFLQYQLPD